MKTENERIAEAIAEELDMIAHRYGIRDEDDRTMREAAALLRSELVGEPHGSEWKVPSAPPADDCPHRRAEFVFNNSRGEWEMVRWLDVEPVGEPVEDTPEFSATLLLPPWFTIDEVLDVEEKLREAIYATTDRDVYVRCRRAPPAPPGAPEAQEPERCGEPTFVDHISGDEWPAVSETGPCILPCGHAGRCQPAESPAS